MKTIIKALGEIECKPRKKWWGFVEDNKRYLCRYSHIFLVFDLKENKILHKYYETITDKRGVEFAINFLKIK